jgi:hypothetical protein
LEKPALCGSREHWLISSCIDSNTDWVRTPLTSTNGPNNVPGSTRSFNIRTDVGTYPFTEMVSESSIFYLSLGPPFSD